MGRTVRNVRSLRFSVFWISFVLMLPNASAGSRETKERAAKRACLTGDPVKGVGLLVDLYLDTNDPTYIFNQGRCFEQNSRCADAVARFREYLRKAKDADATDRADAEKHIADCQALLGKDEAGRARPGAVEPAVPVNPSLAVPPGPAPTNPVRVVVAQPMGTTSTEAQGSTLRTAGILTASVGAAVLIAGLVLNIKYNNTIDDLQRHYDPNRDSSNKTTKSLVLVGYGAGAVCLAGGAVLYFLGWNAGTATVAPAAVAGSPGAVLLGAF